MPPAGFFRRFLSAMVSLGNQVGEDMLAAHLLLIFALGQAATAASITGPEAKKHIGVESTVCGVVASTRYLETSASRMTFLNFDRPNPNQTFTVVIFGEHREKFGRPEVRYKDRQICVTGRIAEFRGTPQIVATDPSQIKEGAPVPVRIHTSEAAARVGDEVTVCGFVASTRYDTTTEGKPSFLFFEKPSPDQSFTAVIYDDVRKKFGAPALKYLHRNVCVTGRLEKFQTIVRMVLTDPRQIAFQ